MFTNIVSHRAVALLCLAVFSIAAFAQGADKPFVPRAGMPGRDVARLPAEPVMVNKMLELAKAGPGDVVVDLGSGDGRMVISAARHGARGIGVELNPDLVKLSRSTAEKEGVAARTRFLTQDMYDFDLNQASVITLFLDTKINMRLRPRILNLKPGTRVISNTFTMEDWRHDDTIRDETKSSCILNCVAFLWVVPAKVAGTWQLPQGELKLEQRFQMLTGNMNAGGRSVPVAGRIRGDQITIAAADTVEFTGRVAGTEMGGTIKINGVPHGWRAVRIGK